MSDACLWLGPSWLVPDACLWQGPPWLNLRLSLALTTVSDEPFSLFHHSMLI